ncbi:cyclophilin-like domain-containing protein [Coemansia spiralis]|nr:cyclophilin-like domain-containing protein [Coemansia spiralis]
MSNIYISEPPTCGKIVLETSVGDIEIELWSKEAPRACKNFVQLCMEGYFNDTIFHRVVPGWIVQGGDPSGTGEGGESIYGQPFADEFHSRLRYSRRGLVGMANSGMNDNRSQFFITLAPTPELQKKNTLFATVVGDSLFNALKLGEGEVDKETERPVYPRKIKHARILDNPFSDIVLRTGLPSSEAIGRAQTSNELCISKKKIKIARNKKLLSFADDGDDGDIIDTTTRSSMKSSHDLLISDPALGKSSFNEPSRTKYIGSQIQTSNGGSIQNKAEETTTNVQRKIKGNPSISTSEGSDIADIQAEILRVEKDIRQLSQQDFDRKIGDSRAAGSGREKAQVADAKAANSSMQLMHAQYKKSGATCKNARGQKPRSNEDDLFEKLGAFRSKIRKTKEGARTQNTKNFAAERDEECRLHSIAGCESCQPSLAQENYSSGGTTHALAGMQEDKGWLSHTLKFKNNKRQNSSEYAPRVEDYVVIDPRQREQRVSKKRK